jgi:hypothetical protein
LAGFGCIVASNFHKALQAIEFAHKVLGNGVTVALLILGQAVDIAEVVFQ